MYAVLIEVDVGGVEREAGLAMLRDRVVPAIRALPGFQSGTWLAGNDQGTGLSLTVWETEEQAREMAQRFGGGQGGVPSAVRCEVREVAVVS